MPDGFKKVRPNENLAIPAQTWNAIIDAARAEARRKLDQQSSTNEESRQSGYILVKNQSGKALLSHSVLGLNEPIFLPSVNEKAFKQQIAFRAGFPVLPQHLGKFCVLIDPLDLGKIGRARVADFANVKIDIIDPTHTCCDVQEGDTDKLVSMKSGGSAQIIWYEGRDEGATGPQWGVVRIGTGCRVCCSSSSSSSSTSTSQHGCREACAECHPATGGCIMQFYIGINEWDFIEPMPSCVCMTGFYQVFHQSGCTWVNTTGPQGGYTCDPGPPPTCILTGGPGGWTLVVMDHVGHSVTFKAPPGSFNCQDPVGGDLQYVSDVMCFNNPTPLAGTTCEGVG